VLGEPDYLKIHAETRSELCVPLKAGNAVIGVLDAASAETDGLTEKDERLLTTLAGQLATAIQKLRYFRDLEQALRQEKAARMQLVQSEKLAAMGRLVASVAHELNNPLQAIQNALYLVKQEPALSEQAFDDLKVAATEADRMAELISRLRDTYRPASGEEFRYESINALVTEVQKLIGTHLRHNNIEFKFDPDPNLPPVPGIRDQLKQVLLNLCLNAVEAMSTGGRLTVRTRHEPAQSSILLTIQDTGLGIKPEALHNIFDPFFTTKETGTGLGLTITYDIIQRHKGRIEVDSQPGHGTTFSIWLPIEIVSVQP
jgi:two-component system NtrC family sensor kinase